MPVRKANLALLAPYLEGTPGAATHHNKLGQPEQNMRCPLHIDAKRSASLNLETGEWICFGGCGAGRVAQLIRRQAEWVPPDLSAANGNGAARRVSGSVREELPSEALIDGWQSALMSNEGRLNWLVEKRGLNAETIEKFEVGWARDGYGHTHSAVYTIPVRAQDGTLLNVRFYDPAPRDDRRKIWGVTDHNEPVLYPQWIFNEEPERLVLAEGEWDAMLTWQNGYPAVTRTGAADVWRAEWTPRFAGIQTFLTHDMDTKGQGANRTIGRLLARVTDARIVKLPYPVTAKHGADLTDFWLEHDRRDFEKLLAEAQPINEKKTESEPEVITVLDSFDSRRVGDPVRMIVTIKGKQEPGFTIPSTAQLTCTRDAGDKCKHCTMFATPGEATYEISPNDPVVLELVGSTSLQVPDIIRRGFGAQKCTRLTIEADGHQAVETLYARPSIDHADTDAGSHKNITITSVGRHDTLPNNTVKVTGALYPSPRDQSNKFLAWDVERQETSVDRFELTPEVAKLMRRFQSSGRPLAKLAEIAKQLSAHVTHIVGRPEMHALMILTFHSVLSFKFGGEMVTRGWLESIVLGDTQQGKSEAARGLCRHYSAGEVVSCEAATFAGIVGGAQQFGGGREWAITWGAIPINDRRLVVLEEVSGLHPEEISQMSDIRTSGVAKITKIQQEATWARTRLLWVGNPRESRMSDYTYGVQALRPLIGNNEDIARFDLAMSVALGEVDPFAMNQRRELGDLRYTSEACQALVRWAWTRQPEQMRWAAGAEQEVYRLALEMGERYVEDPPLVQVSNIRHKIARVACALAAATYSTDETGELLVVEVRHVKDAVAFMDKLYSMPGFGYAERSRELIDDREEALRRERDMRAYLQNRKGLAKFLRSAGRFQARDLEAFMNMSKEEASAVVNTLWDARMVRKERGEVVVEPTLHQLLREVRV